MIRILTALTLFQVNLNPIHSFSHSRFWFIGRGHGLYLSAPVVPTLENVKYRIDDIVPESAIEAIKLRYISVSTQQMALECRDVISQQRMSFQDLARNISLCEYTRDRGGDAGWITTDAIEKSSDAVPQKSSSFPLPEILNAAYNLKKGETSIVSSPARSGAHDSSEWHFVQLMDVQSTLSPMLKKRKLDNYQSLAGESSTNLIYFMETMGCQMNSADSERMAGQLADLGYARTEDSGSANLVIFNTCSIRDHAEHKVYSHIGPHALRKKKGENVKIVVRGLSYDEQAIALSMSCRDQ